MATPAGENTISKEAIEAYLDRFEGMEDAATSIMMSAMKDCKDGPRKDQKDLRTEMKSSGVRMKTFNALWAARKAMKAPLKQIDNLEDDDLDQLREVRDQFGTDSPFGAYLSQLMDEPRL